MSGKKSGIKLVAKAKPKTKLDSRTRRTRDALGDALVELMQERPFKSITVQDVLDRAEVGRSTFYAHYRDKDDLFLSDVEEFWEMMSSLLERSGEESNRVAPIRELFSHVAEAKNFREALVASGKAHDVMELGQGQFARAIEQRLVKLSAGQGIAPRNFAAEAHALAGAMFSSLGWWIDRGMPVSATEMDDNFHRLVWSGVKAAAPEQAAKPGRSTSR
jgi:AcrR family transcriptional regulator